MTRLCPLPASVLASLLITLPAVQAQAAPDPAAAAHVFEIARTLCTRDAGTLWGTTMCGPILIVDPADRGAVANQADPGGALAGTDGTYTGTLPPGVVLANTRLDWSGTAWTQLLWPLPEEAAQLRVLLAHEMFHRIQPGLGLARAEAGNRHLDSLEGRYLLQLEWRALARALMAIEPEARRGHITDALAFRGARRGLFAAAAIEENALEINEGVAEYTGVRLGLSSDEARRAFAVYDTARLLDSPGFVRAFAYASGPAYGLLLDDADPAWRTKLGADADLGRLLAAAHRIGPGVPSDLDARKRRYDAEGRLRASEEARERERIARVDAWRATLVDGPVLVLPLASPSFQFNPQTLAALDDIGTVYPTLRLGDAWGELVVDGGAALVHADRTRATVALPAGGAALKGNGWTLALKPGWSLVPGARPGDATLRRADTPPGASDSTQEASR